MGASGGNRTARRSSNTAPQRRPISTLKNRVSVVGAYPALAETKIGSLFFGGKKWVRSPSSIAKMGSRVVSHNLILWVFGVGGEKGFFAMKEPPPHSQCTLRCYRSRQSPS